MSKVKKIFKKVLDNGLTIIVKPNHIIPKVSIQLWYNVGSKDEKMNQKGIAHLIEHMIFKGTKKLSESDINLISHKLSGYCNAFTSYDYTGYLFDFPSHHWHEALHMMADCMQNCTFKQELLNSEMKAVIQELKMYRDNYPSSLIEKMISAQFPDHPYHYPIIGFKQDLWNLQRDNLVAFYKKHYVPNNATLVVVGDVEPEEVFTLAKECFGSIAPNPTYIKEEFYASNDLVAQSVTLYRDVQQSFVALSFRIPGAQANKNYLLDVLSWVLGMSKGSRLHKKLIDELHLVSDIETFNYDLFDHGLFFICFQPNQQKDIQKIIDLIQQELDDIQTHGVTEQELIRAEKQIEAQFLDTLECNQKQACAIGQGYLATGDENWLFNYLDYNKDNLAKEVQEFAQIYLRPSIMHTGTVLPLNEKDRQYWLAVQKLSDQEDARILSGITREVEVEPGVQVHTINVQQPKPFAFPKPEKITLANGLQVLYYHNPQLPKIDLVVDIKTKHHHDPDELEGLNTFVSNMLLEGTKNYSGTEFAQTLESLGMSLATNPGSITMSMLPIDLAKGLSFLREILTNATFDQTAIDKVRTRMQTCLKDFWDNPTHFAAQLAREHVYQQHPYHKNPLGTTESIARISQEHLINFYHNAITPNGATLAIVGDLQGYDLQALLNEHLGPWQRSIAHKIDYPKLVPLEKKEVNAQINRDQIVLTFAGQSINRLHPDFDNLLVFDQILTGSILGSMSSRLFALREQSGLFYTIGGSLLTRVDEQPGMIFIKTIVSQDRLAEAEKTIAHTIDTATQTIHEHELRQAKDALKHSLVDNFESNQQIAKTFLYLHRFGLPFDYFDSRANIIEKISKNDIQKAVNNILDMNKLVTIRIGRI